ncbi:multidrug effflux MFS transporter [Enterovirga rhinocerotis]|uniref:multidrug effflux MFS transporter n=1 Tax=Enterovirga rhinocerotis TaxID=1339210 RepID=UPI002479089B|nr:multidrug effflux MFS transporter [Enterovirga rhinocerotis]
MTMSGTVALHIFIPALSTAGRELGASPATAQLTITLYLVGLAIGQLVYGPLSDRFGRRPVLLGSLVAYFLGMLLAIPAESIGALIVARVLQSLGACGALVLGRAMVRDISNETDAAKRLAVLITCMTLTPTLAPGLGGLIEAWLGWRAIFVVLAFVVGSLLLLAVALIPETNRNPVSGRGVGFVLGGFARLLRSAKFRRYLLAGSCAGTSLYAFLSAAPFLYIELLHRSPQEVGLFCVVVSVGLAAGAMAVRVLIGRMEIRHGARLGNGICVLAALLLMAAHFAGMVSVGTLTGTMLIYAFGAGLGGPNAVAGAMSVDPAAAGSASGLYGFCQMALGALATLAVGLWYDGTALPLSVVLTSVSVASAIALQRL